jgi:hypothetical protein
MVQPKKVQSILEKIKNADFISGDIRAFCEYKIIPSGCEDDYENFVRIYACVQSSLDSVLYAFRELIKDKKITYLCVSQYDKWADSYDINDIIKEFKYEHPHYTGGFFCDDLDEVATEITAESHAKLIYEIENGDYDDNGEFIGYNGNYEGRVFDEVTKI